MFRKIAEGFSLIELMVAVAIVGVLVALAIPLYRHFQMQAARADAILTLNAIHKSEMAYFAERSKYTANPYLTDAAVGSVDRNGWELYNLQIANGGDDYFAIVRKNLDGDPTLDIWHIKTSNNIAALNAAVGCLTLNQPYLWSNDEWNRYEC